MQKAITFESEVLEDGHLSIPKDIKEQLHLKKGDKIIASMEPLHGNDLKKDPAYNLSRWAVDTGIEDLAQEHNHYLYGIPKTTEK